MYVGNASKIWRLVVIVVLVVIVIVVAKSKPQRNAHPPMGKNIKKNPA